jgi:DNA-binding IclR family transcriptional regulator
MINSTEIRLLESFNEGTNYVDLYKLAKELGLCYPTFLKYINLLQEKGYIKKSVVGKIGGAKNDRRLQAIVYRIK